MLSSRRSSASLRTVPRTAATCPCGSDRSIANSRGSVPLRPPPFSNTFSASITPGGNLLKFASVRFCGRPSLSRYASRSRTAGGELRFGTMSMNMPSENHRSIDLGIPYMDTPRPAKAPLSPRYDSTFTSRKVKTSV